MAVAAVARCSSIFKRPQKSDRFTVLPTFRVLNVHRGRREAPQDLHLVVAWWFPNRSFTCLPGGVAGLPLLIHGGHRLLGNPRSPTEFVALSTALCLLQLQETAFYRACLQFKRLEASRNPQLSSSRWLALGRRRPRAPSFAAWRSASFKLLPLGAWSVQHQP